MPNPIAVLTDALDELTLDDALDWCAAHGATGVELGVGGYSPAPHVDRRRLLADPEARTALLAAAARAGVSIAALNASGNPLHPDLGIGGAHAQALRDAVELAAQLGVDRVVAMSGCPGGPADPPGGPQAARAQAASEQVATSQASSAQAAGSWPVFAGGAWLPDMEGLWEPQFDGVIAPFWRELSEWAAGAAPGVVICLELHPGTSIYNAESYRRLRAVTAKNVAVNLDPSHFWWQGIDPIATIEALGDAIGFVHGKDTLLHPDRIALHGVLDFRWPAGPETMPWHFCAVGAGRPIPEWAALLGALADAGYDGPISIEHEDPNLDPAAGIDASIAGLRAAAALPAADGSRPIAHNATPPATVDAEQRST